MAYLERQQLQIRDTTNIANVPNSDIGKIMYYLNCVCYCIDYNDNDIKRYTNYSRWASLSDEEDKLVYFLALTLNPNILIGKVFFQSDALSRDMQGRFYEIGQVRQQLVVVPSLVIAGRTCQVQRILAFKQEWLKENYIEPMLRLQQRFRSRTSRSCVIS
ncbi:hypothetical protein I4U23_020019 [Adineta vaga]|nr:hypothetical protein I4U23_020019 [Adineta vaga]